MTYSDIKKRRDTFIKTILAVGVSLLLGRVWVLSMWYMQAPVVMTRLSIVLVAIFWAIFLGIWAKAYAFEHAGGAFTPVLDWWAIIGTAACAATLACFAWYEYAELLFPNENADLTPAVTVAFIAAVCLLVAFWPYEEQKLAS